MYARIDQAFQALQIGAQGYVLKESVCIELVNAVHTVHAGRRYLSQEISD
jgi:DNA-binding NarL/FixJ family response regulator